MKLQQLQVQIFDQNFRENYVFIAQSSKLLHYQSISTKKIVSHMWELGFKFI